MKLRKARRNRPRLETRIYHGATWAARNGRWVLISVEYMRADGSTAVLAMHPWGNLTGDKRYSTIGESIWTHEIQGRHRPNTEPPTEPLSQCGSNSWMRNRSARPQFVDEVS